MGRYSDPFDIDDNGSKVDLSLPLCHIMANTITAIQMRPTT